MTSFNFYLFLLALITVCLTLYCYRSRKFNSPSKIVEDFGEAIIVRQSPFSRVTKLLGKPIKKADIAKLRSAKNCLTIFTKSNNAYDIWLSEKHMEETVGYFRNLFPNAEYSEIKS
jgi:uncharacterized membrane protein YvbJ